MLAPGIDPAAVAAADAARRPVARSSALILEHPRLSAPSARWPVNRAISQVALVGLMVVAVLALAIARFSGPSAVAVASPSPTASPTASATPRLTPSPSASGSTAPSGSAPASPSASAGGSAKPSVSPSSSARASAEPSFSTIYVVKKGDTLVAIAAQFKTTVAAIKELNGLKDSSLKIGQKLKIP